MNIDDVATRKKSWFPFCFMLDCGIPCGNTCLALARFLQLARFATGDGANYCLDAIREHHPQIIGLQCVQQRTEAKGLEEISDAKFIAQQLESAGYWAMADVLDAADWGSWVNRRRCLWGAIKADYKDKHVISNYFTSVLGSFKTNGTLPMEDFISLDRQELQAEHKDVGFNSWNAIGCLVSQAKQDGCDYKVDHMKIFHANNLAWPIDWDDACLEDCEVDFGGMLPRENELCWLTQRLWPCLEMDADKFFDVNFKTFFTLNQTFLTDEYVRKTGTAAADQGPWRPAVPSLTGSGKVVWRHTELGHSFIRIIEKLEYTRIMGWSDESWRKPLPDWLCGQSGKMLVSDMMGNAFSVFHMGPFHLAPLASWGKFPVPIEEDLHVSEGRESPGSSVCTDDLVSD